MKANTKVFAINYVIKFEYSQRKKLFERKTKRKKKSEGKENAKNSKPCKPWRCTHTHTHTSTFKKIKRVAKEATLFGVKNRLFVALYEEKNKVLEIACFLSARKIIPAKLFLEGIKYEEGKESLYAKKIKLMREFYTRIMTISNLAKVGGVE